MKPSSKVPFILALALAAGAASAQVPATGVARPPAAKPPAALAAPQVPAAAVQNQAGFLCGPNGPKDRETLVQCELTRLREIRDRVVKTTAAAGSAYSKLTFTPVTGNSCIDENTTWNLRSGELYECLGLTNCQYRGARWSKNRSMPCEPGVVIDSCVLTSDCKAGHTCDTSQKRCI